MGIFIIMISEAKARKYCKEDISLIENYEQAINDNTQKWHCHHRRETIYTREGLIEIGEYYHRPACELIFLTKTEHNKIHKTGNKYCLGNHHSEKTKKMSDSHIGKHHYEDTKKKISESLSKHILQYTKYGELIKEWTSGTEASRVLGIAQSTITRCCQGKYKSAGGFKWTYA